MNKAETQKMAVALEKMGFEIYDKSSNILWFGSRSYKGPLKFRDDKKDSIIVSGNKYRIYFSAEVNPAGVGDGKKPVKALTYQIGFYLLVKCRHYKSKNWYIHEYYKFYNYTL